MRLLCSALAPGLLGMRLFAGPLHLGCAGIALTVALLIIGDEILAGKVEDTNSSFLCRELYALGWRVVKVRPPNPCKLSCKSLKPGMKHSWGR